MCVCTWHLMNRNIYKRRATRRTCELKRRVATDDAETSERVGGVAVVHADVGLGRRRPAGLAGRQDSQEEQLAARKQHPVDARVLVGGDDRAAVAVPGDVGRRLSLGLAVQSRRVVADHVLVVRVLDDERVRYLAYLYSPVRTVHTSSSPLTSHTHTHLFNGPFPGLPR